MSSYRSKVLTSLRFVAQACTLLMGLIAVGALLTRRVLTKKVTDWLLRTRELSMADAWLYIGLLIGFAVACETVILLLS